MELILWFIVIALLLFKRSSEGRVGGCINVPVANFKPPTVPSNNGGRNNPPTKPKPAFRPPSQYKNIQIPKQSICRLEGCKCCKNKEDYDGRL